MITTPFLYEHIRIVSEVQMDKLMATLSSNARERLGPLILRLDLQIDDLLWECPSESTPDQWSPAPQLCLASPNLTTLVTESTWEGEPRIADILPRTLRHVCFLCTFVLSFKDWVSFMDKHPALESVDPPRIDLDTVLAERSVAKGKQWPTLKELVFHVLEADVGVWTEAFPTGSLPNLQRLVLRKPVLREEQGEFSRFLRSHGQNLEQIHLVNSDPEDPCIPVSLFPILSELCLKLNRVVWMVSNVYRLEEWWSRQGLSRQSADFQLLCVTTLEVQLLDPPSPVVLNVLESWVAALPQVKKVVLQEADLEELRCLYANELHEFVKGTAEVGLGRGGVIVVEDENGRVVEV